MKKSKKSKDDKIYGYNKIAAVGVFILLCIFPLFMTDGYHNITISKYHFFCISAICFTLLSVVSYYTGSGYKRNIKEQKNTTDICMLIFMIACIASWLFSSHRIEAFSGSAGRHMGLVLMLLMIMAYFFVSRAYIISYREIALFGISIIIICAFAVIQYIGFDPFNLLADILKKQRKSFIAFSGNINVFASYLCISVPLFMYLFCTEIKKKRLILYTCTLVFGFFGIITSNSDSGILGLAAAFFIIFLLCCKDSKMFSKFWLLVSICASSFLLFSLLRIIFKSKVRRAETLYVFLLKPWLCAAVILISLTLFLIIRKFPISEKALKIIRISVIVLTVLIIISFIAAIVYFTFFNTKKSLGKLSHYLRFNNKWGSERGKLWRKLAHAYAEFPILKKIFGAGEDTVALVLKETYGSSIKTTVGQYFDNAHNEPFQYLVTLGIFGVSSYLASLGTAVKSGIKSDAQLNKAAAVCVCVYFVQSLVALNQPITTPLLFIFLGLTRSRSANE